MTKGQKTSLGGVLVATVTGVSLLLKPTVGSPPSVRLEWSDPQAKWGKQFRVWQGDSIGAMTNIVAVVLTNTNSTETNFSIVLPRTNDHAFYRVSASWRN